jgi:hypothetical protein
MKIKNKLNTERKRSIAAILNKHLDCHPYECYTDHDALINAIDKYVEEIEIEFGNPI